ncbi:MAG: molybdopterin-dependent oxidoreductase [Pseudomonadota bacterium]
MARYTASHWGAYRIEDDELRPIAEDPAPSRIGKGWASAMKNSQSRVLRPAIRSGWLAGDQGADRGRDTFVEVGWDQAIELAAKELNRVRHSRGNGSIFAGSYGWASAGRFHHAQSQMRRFLNLIGGFVGSRDSYSHAAAEVLFPLITGYSSDEMQARMPSWPDIAENASLIVAFGGISSRTAQINSSGTSTHGVEYWLRKTTARCINISPQQTDFPDAEWLPIRPGTDVALMLGLCHTLLDEDLHDVDFLHRCTSGWPIFKAYLEGRDGTAKSADWAAALCDIPAGDIRAIARDMAKARTLVAIPWALQRAHHGEMPIWAALALACMLGQIGQPGTGYAFGLGCVTSVGRPVRQDMRWPSLPQGDNPIDDFIPVARLAEMLERPGAPYTYNLETRTFPDIRLVYWVGGNPFHHHQDLQRLDRAWRRPETVIVHEPSWTATARRADIVLPSTSPLERHDIMMSRADPRLIYMSPFQAAAGEALDDHEIFRRLAALCGVEEAFTEGRDVSGWLRVMWDRAKEMCAQRRIDLPDFDTFRTEGRYDLPEAPAAEVLWQPFVADPAKYPLATESGRLTLHNAAIAAAELPDCPGHAAWRVPFETLLDAPPGMLHLLSGQPDTRLHSQNDRGAEALADKISGREPCYVHPETAAERGISEHQIVRLWNERGATLAGVRFSDGLRRDCVSLATGAWYDPGETNGAYLERAGNPNAVTRDLGCSGLSQGTSAHTALVWLEPWTGPVPPLSIDQPPRFEPRK